MTDWHFHPKSGCTFNQSQAESSGVIWDIHHDSDPVHLPTLRTTNAPKIFGQSPATEDRPVPRALAALAGVSFQVAFGEDGSKACGLGDFERLDECRREHVRRSVVQTVCSYPSKPTPKDVNAKGARVPLAAHDGALLWERIFRTPSAARTVKSSCFPTSRDVSRGRSDDNPSTL